MPHLASASAKKHRTIARSCRWALPLVLIWQPLAGVSTGHAEEKADAPGPVLEPLKNINVETKSVVKFAVKAKGAKDAALRFAITHLRKDGAAAKVPNNMSLVPRTGAFAWTPTPAQAGVYDLTVTVSDGNDMQTKATVQLKIRPRTICTTPGPIGDLLRKWYAAGTAAGNTGDYYDNRDRDHSPLNLAPWPQLDQVTYTPEERKKRLDWAAQWKILATVTFGNSSTSAPVLFGGSNVRLYQTNPGSMDILYEQYRKNNLYIYPAHHDHHPGHNGKPFYGDVYPANSPYLITSQGSSGSDQPFMRALPYTLAAFRPEVKKTLIKEGLLMPTLQMIFRSSNKHLKAPREYLSGKAHPPVFEGAWVDDLKMVQAAHDIRPGNIPPLVQLKVVKEDAAVYGKDFFDPGRQEKLCDTPCAIARVVRGGKYVRRMVVSAKESLDVNKKPLTYHWVVLRGDAGRIKIKPLNRVASVVELLVPYHERAKVDPASALESNRVDIGAFVHNGTYYSAPGFVTFFSLDNEARAYDKDGRLLESGYDAGDADLRISDWKAFFQLLGGKGKTLALRLLKKQIAPQERDALLKAGGEYQPAYAKMEAARKKIAGADVALARADADLKVAIAKRDAARKTHSQKPNPDTKAALKQAEADQEVAQAVRKRAEEARQAANKETEAAAKSVEDILRQKRTGLDLPVQDLVQRVFDKLKTDPNFFIENQKDVVALAKAAPAGNRGRFDAALKRLTAFGLLQKQGAQFKIHTLRESSAPLAERFTRYEKNLLQRFHAEVLSALVYPSCLSEAFQVNFVDQRITTPKPWRDVYRYDTKGSLLGWTRCDGARTQEFTPDGLVILAKDARGRPVKARTVQYEYEPTARQAGVTGLKQVWGKEVLHYEYKNAQDLKGTIKKKETVPGDR
jgi:hypothetical protein